MVIEQHAANNQWVKVEIKRGITKYLEAKEKWKYKIQNIWDEVEAVLRKKFIAVNAYIDKKGKISNNQPNFIPQ